MSGAESTHGAGSIAHFPVSLVSSVMGLTGLAIAWQKAHRAFAVPAGVWMALAALASAVFVFLIVLYVTKLLRFPEAVRGEWQHPVRVSFFPTISISLMLLATVWADTAPSLAFLLWAGGALLQLGFTLAILSSWMFHSHYDIKHANPAWFIPVVGNLFVPIVGGRFASPELGWFFFSVGIVFWVVLMTIVVYRVVFHDPVPLRLQPTLFILLAPPAVGLLHGAVLRVAARVQRPALRARRFLHLRVGLFLPAGGGDHRLVRHGATFRQRLLPCSGRSVPDGGDARGVATGRQDPRRRAAQRHLRAGVAVLAGHGLPAGNQRSPARQGRNASLERTWRSNSATGNGLPKKYPW
jgi:hypothetical protein